jgi:hypothetical protein
VGDHANTILKHPLRVEGGPTSAEAVQQAIALAPGAEVRFVAVSPTRRPGGTAK